LLSTDIKNGQHIIFAIKAAVNQKQSVCAEKYEQQCTHHFSSPLAAVDAFNVAQCLRQGFQAGTADASLREYS